DSLISYGIGIKSTSNFKDMLKAWIVTDGTGSAAGNPPIQAGQKGRWVFDKNLDLKPSEVETPYLMPDGFNQEGNDWVRNSVQIFEREFIDYIERGWNNAVDEIGSCI